MAENVPSQKEPVQEQKVGLLQGDWFERHFPVPEQPKFPDTIRHVVLAPIRAELGNGSLLHFLRDLNRQRGLDKDEKTGLILLLNDNIIDDKRQMLKEKDLMDLPTAVPENRLTAQYLSGLIKGDLAAIDKLDIGREYKDIAREILDSGKSRIDLRFDYINKARGPHMGRLRQHLLTLLEAYRPEGTDPNQIVAHFMDVDTGLSPQHLSRLRQYFADAGHAVNVSAWDLIPDGNIEDPAAPAISDQFRVYMALNQLHSVLRGNYNSGSPTISGRLAVFSDPGVKKVLEANATGEDFMLVKFLREKYGADIGHTSEVYFAERSRPSSSSKFDADTRWNFQANGRLQNAVVEYDTEDNTALVRAKTNDELEEENVRKFDLGNQLEEYIEFIEGQLQNANPGRNVRREAGEYVRKEERREAAKIKLRRIRLAKALTMLEESKEPGEVLSTDEMRLTGPYLDLIRRQADHEKPMSRIEQMQRIMEAYPSFFHFDDTLHRQNARIRGLVAYCVENDLTMTVGKA